MATDSSSSDVAAASNALRAKTRGNAFYLKADYKSALDSYTLAIEHAGATMKGEWLAAAMAQPETHRSLLAELRLPAGDVATCYANRAACHIQLRSYVAAELDASVAIELRPEYVKALYRRGQAREALEEYSNACEDMRRVAQLDPSVKAAAEVLPRLEELAQKKRENRVAACAASKPGAASSKPNSGEAVISILEYDPKQPVLEQVLANRKRLLHIHQDGRLAAQDIADYKKFLSGMALRLNRMREDISRKSQLLKLRRKQAEKGRRAADTDGAAQRTQAAISAWNRDNKLLEREQAWLISLPAFQQTQAIAKEKFKLDSSGEFYDVEEVRTPLPFNRIRAAVPLRAHA